MLWWTVLVFLHCLAGRCLSVTTVGASASVSRVVTLGNTGAPMLGFPP